MVFLYEHIQLVGVFPKCCNYVTGKNLEQTNEGACIRLTDREGVDEAASVSSADIVAVARAVNGMELVHEAVAICRRDSIGAHGQRVTVDVSFAFCDGPFLVPEVMSLIVAGLATFVRLAGTDLVTSLITVTCGIDCSSHGLRLTVGHVRNRVTTGDERTDESNRGDDGVFHDGCIMIPTVKRNWLEYDFINSSTPNFQP